MAFRIGSPSHLGLLWYLLSIRLRWKESKSTAPVIKQYVIGCHLHGCGTQDALPFFARPPTHRQAPPEKTATFLDVDLFWYGASAILNRTHRGAKTILLGPLWNSLERSWTPWTQIEIWVLWELSSTKHVHQFEAQWIKGEVGGFHKTCSSIWGPCGG